MYTRIPHSGLRLRAAALLGAGALAVHELRYLVGQGPRLHVRDAAAPLRARRPGALGDRANSARGGLEDERFDAPEARGLDVLLRGLSMLRSDEEMLELSGALYDELYEYTRRATMLGNQPA